MAKTSFSQWDTVANNNTDVGGVNIAEGCPPSGINDGMRTMMAQLRSGVDPGVSLTAKAANYTAIAGDEGAWLRFTASATLSLTAAATLLANWYVFVQADGGNVIIDPNAAETINGLATINLKDGEAAYVICDGTNFRAYRFSAPASYIVKTANYTALDTDYNASLRFTSAATLAFDVTANLRTNWRIEVWNDSTGLVVIDPDSTNTINGATTLVLQPGQRTQVFKTAATTFQASIYGDPQSGPQLQGYLYGLTATTNSGTPSTNIDVAAGAVGSSASPYYLIQLLASITKNTNNAWSVGTGNGSLDTGAIANSTYYGYLIQRSDTGVVDVLTSLSSTAPTMPANYDRRSPALFTFTRTAGVNSGPAMIGKSGVNYANQSVNPNLAIVNFPVPALVKRVTAHFSALTPSVSALPIIRLGVAGTAIAAGYIGPVSASNGAAIVSTGDTTGVVLDTGAGTGAKSGHVVFERLSPSLNIWSWRIVSALSGTVQVWGTGYITLAGDVNLIQFTTTGGAALLNGTINVSWEN